MSALGAASAKGKPLEEPRLDHNFAGIKNLNNYTGYTYDYVLDLYFAQNRFYNPDTRQFITQDPIKSGMNWYNYCDSNPLVRVDPLGLYYLLQKVKFVASSPGSSMGDLVFYDEYMISQETWGNAVAKAIVGNVPILGADWYPGSGGTTKTLVHGREYWLIIGGTSYDKSILEDYATSLAIYGAGQAVENLPKIFKSLTQSAAKNLSNVFSLGTTLYSIANRADMVKNDKILYEIMLLNNISATGHTCFDTLASTLNMIVNLINNSYNYFFNENTYAGPLFASKTLYETDKELSKLTSEKATNKINGLINQMRFHLTYGNLEFTLSDGTKINRFSGADVINQSVDDYSEMLKGYQGRLDYIANIV